MGPRSGVDRFGKSRSLDLPVPSESLHRQRCPCPYAHGIFNNNTILYWGSRWRSWLRHCATSQKVAGSIPDGVIEIFHWRNPSGCTMALRSTQPLTEMSTGNISWGLKRPVRRADNLTTFLCRLSWNLGASTSWSPLGLFRPVMGLLYLFSQYYINRVAR